MCVVPPPSRPSSSRSGEIRRVVWIYPTRRKTPSFPFHTQTLCAVGTTLIALSRNGGVDDVTNGSRSSEQQNQLTTLCVCEGSATRCSLPLLFPVRLRLRCACPVCLYHQHHHYLRQAISANYCTVCCSVTYLGWTRLLTILTNFFWRRFFGIVDRCQLAMDHVFTLDTQTATVVVLLLTKLCNHCISRMRHADAVPCLY